MRQSINCPVPGLDVSGLRVDWRVPVPVSAMAAATAAWILVVDNAAFWRLLWSARDLTSWRADVSVVVLALCLWALLTAFVRVLLWRGTGKVVVCVFLVASAIVGHFIDTYGVQIDRQMVRNALQTDLREVTDLLSDAWWRDVGLRGVVPAALVALALHVEYPSNWWRATLGVSRAVALALGITAVAVVSFYADYAATARNNRELRHLLTPTNALNGLWGLWKERARAGTTLMPVATDAKRTRAPGANGKPLVFVLMVGETARAANFSLGGYTRPTNAALARSDIVYFSNVVACGTDTATSLPCMFSDLGAAAYSAADASSRENVLDVLVRAGVDALWIDNNSGCKGVCQRVRTWTIAQETQRWCGAALCLDDALLSGLREAVDRTGADRLVVLHMLGSHGPAYFKRYPAESRHFTPTCDTNSIQSCDREALQNTYDNTIRFTSDVIAKSVGWLEQQSSRVDAVLLYVSDHGESLGERNVYLHGLPKLIAPREQLHVPMLAWVSDGAAGRLGVTRAALQASSDKPYSHDNLFHTLLGAFGVETSAYRSELDIFGPAPRLRVDVRGER